MNAQAEIALCPECGRPIPTAAPEGLCPACLALTAVDEPAPDPAHTPPDQPFANLRFYGDYELIRELGRGAMGVVHLAHQLGVNRPVALKLLVGGAAAGRDFIHRFHTEAATAARLDHPGIVPVYEFGTHDGAYYLAMKYLEGGTLGDRRRSGTPAPPEIARIMIRIAQAVHHAHQHGVLHRDLKPGNILLDTDGQPCVADFGLARLLETDSTLTLSSAIVGTAAYLAPEIARGGASQATTASDIYGLGAVLYELLTGHAPFTGASLADILRKVQEEEPRLPKSEMRRGISDLGFMISDLQTICLKCLDKEPAKRYPTAQALADDLERFLNDEPIHARPVTRLERTWRWCRRKPALASAYGLLLLLLLLLSIASPIAAYRINEARRQAAEEAAIAAAMNEFLTEDLLRQADVWKAEAHASPNRDIRLLEIVDRASEGVDARFGNQPLVAAKIHLTVGSVYAGLGEIDNAEKHLRTAKGLFETHAGPEDLRTLESSHALAVLLRVNRAEFAEAEALIRHVLESRERSLGQSHHDSLAAMIELAAVRLDRQAIEEAQSLYTQAVRLAESALGYDDRVTLDAREGVASALWISGDSDVAAELRKDVLAQRRRAQGESHPDTLSSLAETVFVMRARNEDFATIEGMITNGLALSRPIFGERGPTARLNSQLAILLNHQGRSRESLALRESLRTNAFASAGPNHPYSIHARQYVGYHHAWYGNEAVAIAIFEENIDWFRRHAPYSRDFPSALDWLGRIYWRQGRFQDALKLQEELLGTRHRLHGMDKETTRWAVRDLAALHARIGQWQQAAAQSAELIRFPGPESYDLIGAVIIHELAGNPVTARKTLLAELEGARGRMDSTDLFRADCLGLIFDAPWDPVGPRTVSLRQREFRRSQSATGIARNEPDKQSEVKSPVLAEMAEAIVALREERWISAAALLEPLVARCMDPRDRALAGFLLAYALATEGKPGDARERYRTARLTLERIEGAGDLGDRWVDVGLCALAAAFASRHIDGVEPPPRLDHQSLSGAHQRWQPVNKALEQVWMLARHRRWHEASAATEVALCLPGFDWDTAEAAIIRWPLKLAVIHAMAGDRKAYEAVCEKQIWNESFLPSTVKPISLVANSLDPGPQGAILLDAHEMAFKAEHGVERHEPEWENLATGIYHLQAGRTTEALPHLAGARGAYNLHCRCVALAFSALCELQRGHREEALTLLASAESVLNLSRENQPEDLGRLWFEMGLSEMAVSQTVSWLKADNPMTGAPAHSP